MSKFKWVLNHLEYIIASVLSSVMFTILFIQVIARYVIHHSVPFAEELAVILFILSVYFGAIGATRRHSHLSLELLTNKLSDRNRLIMNIVADVIFIIVSICLTYGCIGVIQNLYTSHMRTAVMGLPKWIPYAVIPFAFVIISIRLIQEIVIICRKLKAHDYTKVEEF